MLLNIGPKSDGSITEEAKEKLLGMGDWLRVNGEAIYESRPWKITGEGPTRLVKPGSFSEEEEVMYTSEDIRFTTKGNALYAMCLDWPGGKLVIKSLAQTGTTGMFDDEIKSVILLGDGKELEWSLTKSGLEIITPPNKPCNYAYTFKILR
jgi:alpha-L-fucosidase